MSSDPAQWGAYLSLSANHGRDWYPPSALGIDAQTMSYSGGQFVGNEVRIYWNYYDAATIPPYDYEQATGILTPDSLTPVLMMRSCPADTVRHGDTLRFAVTASDNDTVSGVHLRLLGETGAQWTVPMTRDSGRYQAAWIVPREDRYRYWFEAEDFWENVGYLPNGEEFQFVTNGWSYAAGDVNPHPTSFRLAVYPNPFNAQAQIRFALPQTSRATLTVYDLAGREVAVLADETFAAGLPSGVYFARLHAGEFSATRKLLLLR